MKLNESISVEGRDQEHKAAYLAKGDCPIGITLSQLSRIPNEVMGWGGHPLSELAFYHQEIGIMEGADEFGGR